MKIVGIDNGMGGGLVMVQGRDVLATRVMPTLPLTASKRAYDPATIAAFLRACEPDHAVLEYAQAFPMKKEGREQGVQSSFSTGYGAGLIVGIVATLGIPYTIVRPQTWMAVMLKGLPRTSDNREKISAVVCRRLWPTVEWKSSQRSAYAHSGLTDAACLAEYGRRTIAGPERAEHAAPSESESESEVLF